MLKAIIFDVDGTLADTEEYHRNAFNETFKHSGLEWHWSVALYEELLKVTGGKERITHYINTRHPDFKPPVAGTALTEYVSDLHQRKTACYKRMLMQGDITLRPGVERLIRQARQQKMRLAIATTTSMQNVTTLLSNTLGDQAITWFDTVVSGEMVKAKKPAADVYNQVLSNLALPATECIAIEDSQLGLASALSAGITTVITVDAYTKKHNFHGAALVIDNMGEPENPFTILSGDSEGIYMLNTALLQKLYTRNSVK